MGSSYPNPWNFSNDDSNMVSPDGKFRIEYGELNEIAMGAPIGGECFLVCPDNSKLKLNGWAAGPAVWDRQSRKAAFPVWTKKRQQKLAVIDIDSKTLSIYARIFRVVDIKSFDQTVISGQDSPIYKTRLIEFDITKRKVEEVESLPITEK